MSKKSDNRRVLFRADGNNEIGLGHIYRCLAISERLKGNFDCFFAIRQPSIELESNISKYSSLIRLAEFEDYLTEAKEIALNVIPQYEIDIVVLDGYYFNTDYQKIIKDKSARTLVSIDDDQPFHYVSDIVINHAGGIRAENISRELYTKLYLGYDYLLLRKEFIQAFAKEKHIADVSSVLICFGGADPDDLTGQLFECLKYEKSINKIVVVIGASYAHKEKLKIAIFGYSHVDVFSNLDAKTFSGIMRDIDLAIVPSSTVGLEAFASHMILITGMTAENQKNIYKGLVSEDSVMGIGYFNNLNCDAWRENIKIASQKFHNYTFEKKLNNNDSVLNIFKSISL